MTGAPGLPGASAFTVARHRRSEFEPAYGAARASIIDVGEAGERMLRFDVSSSPSFLSPKH